MLIKTKRIERIVYIFVILGLISILSLLVLVGRGKRLFSSKNYYYSRFNSGEGLNKGMPVNINGIQIGTLESIKLDGNNNIALKLSIYEEHIHRIRKGSVLRLISPLLGSKTLDIIPGDIYSAEIKNNDYIPSFDSEDGKKILLARKSDVQLSTAENILANVSSLVQRLNEPNGPLFANLENFKIISQNIGKLSEKFANNQERIDSIFKHVEDTTVNLNTISRSIMKSQFFKEKETKPGKQSIDLNESYSPYKNK
ncbi:MAG: MlaD family protein [Elusimicrobia bacterium]|nr:MlaD family protein [Elusimicrobiota bacterium]